MARAVGRVLLAGLACLLVAPRIADAQLVSPGKLAAPHAALEGMANCTRCHDLGKRGASDAKCLQCHTTLRARVEAKEGLHATYAGRSCASCHKDHFGADFALVRFDTAAFDHARTGYPLRLAHAQARCRDCHTPALVADTAVRAYATRHRTLGRTYLGLATRCVDCHRRDDPHGTQFGARSCASCHTEAGWDEAPGFSHDSTRFVLTGKHATVRCEQCHRTVAMPGAPKPTPRYVGVRAAPCTACHADPHRGAMRQPCESCHDTQGWARLRDRTAFEANFDHARTPFALRGAHAKAACASCHSRTAHRATGLRLSWRPGQGNAQYPAPVATDCLSCHVDRHDATFAHAPGGPACQNCHGESAWLPALYDVARHDREAWPLTGAHVTVACVSCHPAARVGEPPRFTLGSRTCESCHKADDPHAGQFGDRTCTQCHVTDTFRLPGFDHAGTRWPLDGAHRTVACAKCHTATPAADGRPVVRYRPLPTTCRACHGADTPRRP